MPALILNLGPALLALHTAAMPVAPWRMANGEWRMAHGSRGIRNPRNFTASDTSTPSSSTRISRVCLFQVCAA
jgi:hypothetical protein